ncbi:hypothetical protein [Pedobacter gandavensis]|nr:hypothetical protein [Pedobacter gandavensis]
MNVGGNSSFTFIPVYLVVSLPPIQGKLITSPVVLSPGQNMLNGYSTLEELDFKETQKDEDDGPFYQIDISGFMPGDSPDLIDLMENMEMVRHLVIVKDNLNQKRLVGYNAPLSFRATFQSGSKPGEARGYKYSFSGLSAKRSPVYRLG